MDDTGDDTRRSGEFGHIPVMGRRIVELLTPALESEDRRVFLDATLGAGGHSELILNTFPNVHLVGIDRDASALDIARRRLAPHADRISLHQATFHEIADVLDDAGEESIDAALFDLGVSSMQLDQAGRGFAYSVDAPLDMRMNSDDPVTAADVLNTYGHGELARVLSEYGEERFAGKIASAVLREREKEPFTTSARLVELLYATIPAATRRTGGHPAKRTFQALRIEVNHELDVLREALPTALSVLTVGGRVAVMSYQSLEDRIVKREFAARTTSTSPPGLPVELPGTAAEFRLVTRGAERPDDEELSINPRSAPVRVRAVERVEKKG
ncbi:16S rRNA (cytosine(1402)-N(4))-methyltransferase RsmH [Gordonia alkanivorans]|uniref:16S rRNA (cytosine(1402)-N(4))-methyltransferase RsmH n=1 Tax=Gordonia alkanivorans TaxID=84096 RepID=UPI000FDD7573|nr:16S rRNA (cytosine(1402)-N(4))-methyltransferase RsmH [Gordonia alkanivorans]AZZ81779.1 16S rRNA (cytosine(1402)-N(4))-methyltransferase [Gordonia alkanivorans]MDH3007953.1 16S rRNA (cytosine(1402)-N(4))-methyltransferase RsmH [Gordonia alkanivorans]MDH3016686.1 16S rRNA (cytosine(1402)-N(4))-methyltransferase RsmH [Gordonia alkanivorans]MDH3041931.1 16S rRNA (cytosine(1402)-N(4))-methyltransferase RsmH [Gordonia alkanivorans]MDH3060235.1 16S rRNA (cytosine(1402)-N(4))-methyltransferase Rsm